MTDITVHIDEITKRRQVILDVLETMLSEEKNRDKRDRLKAEYATNIGKLIDKSYELMRDKAGFVVEAHSSPSPHTRHYGFEVHGPTPRVVGSLKRAYQPFDATSGTDPCELSTEELEKLDNMDSFREASGLAAYQHLEAERLKILETLGDEFRPAYQLFGLEILEKLAGEVSEEEEE